MVSPTTSKVLRRLTVFLGHGILIFALSSLFLSGCEKESSGPSDNDIQLAQELVDEGMTLLATAFDNFEPGSTTPADFDTPKQKFEEALDLDPNNNDARVGLALCEIGILAQDEDLLAALGEIVPIGPFGKARPGGDQGFRRVMGGSAESLPEQLTAGGWMTWMQGRMTKVVQDGPPPDLGPLQDVIEAAVLPVVDAVIDLFETIEADSEWELILTPDMTGMEEGQLEIDVTDIYFLDGLMHALKAQLHFLVSYNMNVPDIADTTATKAALNQTDGTLGVLRTNGSTHMANVRGSLLDAISKMNNFQISLAGEEADQTYDLIKLDPTGDEGPSQEDLDEIADNLGILLLALSAPYTVTADFDNDGLDEDLRVDLSSFFTSPVNDLKQLLPPYEWNSMYMAFLWEGYPGNFALFVFPDPTMGGFLPDLTTDSAFKTFFNITDFPAPGPFGP